MPPIWVAAWESQSRRNGRFARTASAPLPVSRWLGGGALRRGRPGPPTRSPGGLQRGRDRGIAPLHESREAPFQGRPGDEDVAAAAAAAQADVGPEAVDEPRVAAARMRPLEANDIAEEQREEGRWGIRPVRVSEPWLAMARDERPCRRRQLEPIDRRDRDLDARERGLQAGDDAAGARQRSGERRRVADRIHLERIAERRVLDRDGARRARHDRPGHDPHAIDRVRLRAGVAQLVQEVLDGRAGDLAGDGDLDPGSGDRQEAGPGADAGEVRLQLAERRVAASPGRGEGVELIACRRDLGPQLVVAGVEVRDEVA